MKEPSAVTDSVRGSTSTRLPYALSTHPGLAEQLSLTEFEVSFATRVLEVQSSK